MDIDCTICCRICVIALTGEFECEIERDEFPDGCEKFCDKDYEDQKE